MVETPAFLQIKFVTNFNVVRHLIDIDIIDERFDHRSRLKESRLEVVEVEVIKLTSAIRTVQQGQSIGS